MSVSKRTSLPSPDAPKFKYQARGTCRLCSTPLHAVNANHDVCLQRLVSALTLGEEDAHFKGLAYDVTPVRAECNPRSYRLRVDNPTGFPVVPDDDLLVTHDAVSATVALIVTSPFVRVGTVPSGRWPGPLPPTDTRVRCVCPHPFAPKYEISW